MDVVEEWQVRGDESVPSAEASWGQAGAVIAGEPRADDQRRLAVVRDVPVQVCLAAEARVDAVVGALRGQPTMTGGPPCEEVHAPALLAALTLALGPSRAALRRAARAEAARDRVSASIPITATTAAEGARFIEALDRCQSLGLAPGGPEAQADRAFYTWLIEAMGGGTDATTRPDAQPRSFERFLLDETSRLSQTQRAHALRRCLQRLTEELAEPGSAAGVASAVVEEAVSALGATSGSWWQVADGKLELVRACQSHHGTVSTGDDVQNWARALAALPDHPAASVLAQGTANWLDTREALVFASPSFAARRPSVASVAALPVVESERLLAVLQVEFASPRRVDEDGRAFLLEVADQAGRALQRHRRQSAQRAALREAEATAARLSRLTAVIGEMAGADDVDAIANIIVSHLADAMGASLSSLSVLVDQDTLEVVRLRGARPETVRRWHRYPVAANLPASEAARTGRTIWIANSDELIARYPALVGQPASDRALYCLPLALAERVLGVATLSFPAGHRPVEADERFLATLAETCAQSLARVNALTRAQAAQDKLAFLAEASAELSRSLDYRTTLANVAHMLVPRLADWCAVHVVEDGAFNVLALAHTDPEKVNWARQFQARYPVNPDAATGVPQVVRTGISEFHPDVTDEMLAANAIDEEHLRASRELGVSSAMVVPLTGRGSTLGAITLVHAESGRRYDAADLTLAEDLARRAAIAIENARAYQQQRGRLAAMTRVAEAAQRAILAPIPRRLGPLRLDAAYVSAARDAHVGGDLYEVVRSGDRVRIIVGDVRGKGLAAVRLATVVLGAFRSAAADCDQIAEVARRMDSRLRAYLSDEDFVTALLAEVRDDGSCEVVCCGHPAALLAHGGKIRELTVSPSLPLGLGADPQPVRVRMQAGDRLLLYTDGLLEARRPDRRFIDLTDIVAPMADAPHASILRLVLQRLRADVGSDLGDDLALLLAEYAPTGEPAEFDPPPTR